MKLRQEEMVQQSYAAAPDDLKRDVRKAIRWAKDYLCKIEGSGHFFHLSHERVYDKTVNPWVLTDTGMIQCSFAKPSWAGDHCSRGMPTGAEAVVMAVCEYLNGA